MLLFVLLSLLSLPPAQPVATPPSLQIMEGASLIPPRSQNSSTATTDSATSISSSLPQDNIDPRFTYEKYIADKSLDRSSAYLNTLLALEDLSTKGWTSILSFGTVYTFSGYGGVTVRVSASLNPSSLQYRHAIWGLYFAIREASSHDFRACILTLYWSPVVGKSRHAIGYVSILGPPTPSINAGDSTEAALEHTNRSRQMSLPNFTANDNSTSFTIAPINGTGLGFRIKFEDRRIDIDSVFQTIYAGVVYLASFPQSRAVTQPGLIKGDIHTFLRWDFTTATQAWPSFEYRYALAALSAMAVCMYERARFQEVRVFTYVNEREVGVCWLYRDGIGGDSDAK